VKLSKAHMTILRDAVSSAKASIPELHSLLPDEDVSDQSIHLSLSRPMYVRAHQRDNLRFNVRSTAQKSPSFDLSFAQHVSLVNDERTRIFLSVEVGAGHADLVRLTEMLKPHLLVLRQQPYYEIPCFHISVAWALLTNPTVAGRAEAADAQSPGVTNGPGTYPSILDLPEGLLAELEASYGDQLRRAGKVRVENLEIKIGKVTSRFGLGA